MLDLTKDDNNELFYQYFKKLLSAAGCDDIRFKKDGDYIVIYFKKILEGSFDKEQYCRLQYKKNQANVLSLINEIKGDVLWQNDGRFPYLIPELKNRCESIINELGNALQEKVNINETTSGLRNITLTSQSPVPGAFFRTPTTTPNLHKLPFNLCEYPFCKLLDNFFCRLGSSVGYTKLQQDPNFKAEQSHPYHWAQRMFIQHAQSSQDQVIVIFYGQLVIKGSKQLTPTCHQPKRNYYSLTYYKQQTNLEALITEIKEDTIKTNKIDDTHKNNLFCLKENVSKCEEIIVAFEQEMLNALQKKNSEQRPGNAQNFSFRR